MERDEKGSKNGENRTGIPIEKLPWWTELVIARHSGAKIPPTHICHLHHCANCACIVVCLDAECPSFYKLCPKCVQKSKVAKVLPTAKKNSNVDLDKLGMP